MVGAAVGKLRGRQVENPPPGLGGYLMDETQQVLVGIPEAHAAADPGLEIGGASRQVERHHALVLVPYIDHAVELGVVGCHRIRREQLAPSAGQRPEAFINGLLVGETRDESPGMPLVDDAGRLPFVVFGVFRVP